MKATSHTVARNPMVVSVVASVVVGVGVEVAVLVPNRPGSNTLKSNYQAKLNQGGCA